MTTMKKEIRLLLSAALLAVIWIVGAIAAGFIAKIMFGFFMMGWGAV